jgi:hypothetical protein
LHFGWGVAWCGALKTSNAVHLQLPLPCRSHADVGSLAWRRIWPSVTGSVKMIRFSYSNEDSKDEEGRESWRPEMPLSRCYAPTLNHASPLSRNAPQQPTTVLLCACAAAGRSCVYCTITLLLIYIIYMLLLFSSSFLRYIL